MGNTVSGQPVTQPMMRAGSSFSYPTSRQGAAFNRSNERELLAAKLQELVNQQNAEMKKLDSPDADVKAISAKVEQLEAEKQPLRQQFNKLPLTAAEKNMMAGQSRALQAPESVSGRPTTAKPEQAGLLSRITRRTMDALQDPVANAQIVAALNSLRFEPDPNLTKAVQARATGVQERRQQAQTANRTVEYLKNMGRTDLAQAVELNPAMAGEALTLALTPTKGVVLGKDQRYVDPITGEVLFGPAEATGLTDEQRKGLETFRKEYVGLQSTKDFEKQAGAYTRVVDSARDPSAAGDLALIFNFMKVLDPGSVVRESEFATAARARAELTRAEKSGTVIPAVVAQALQKIESGLRLLPEQRNDFLNRAGMLYSGAAKRHEAVRSYYETEIQKISPTATLPPFGYTGEVLKLEEIDAPNNLQNPPAGWDLGVASWRALSIEEREEYMKDVNNG